MWIRSLSWKNTLEESTSSHSSILAWKILWTEESGRLQSIGSHEVRHNCSDLACTHTQHLRARRETSLKSHSYFWFFLFRSLAHVNSHSSLIGYCPQEDALDDLVTIEEHLYFYARIHGIPEKDIKEVSINVKN